MTVDCREFEWFGREHELGRAELSSTNRELTALLIVVFPHSLFISVAASVPKWAPDQRRFLLASVHRKIAPRLFYPPSRCMSVFTMGDYQMGWGRLCILLPVAE